MSTNRYYGDDIADFKVEINSTELTAGAVTDVSIVGTAEHDELFDPENVTRSEVKRREVSVNVEFTVREFNEELAQYWLNGDGSTTSTTVTNTSDVAEFDVTFEQNMTDHDGSTGDESLKAVVDNVHFPEMPILDMAQGEFNEHSLSGRGDGVTLTKEAVA